MPESYENDHIVDPWNLDWSKGEGRTSRDLLAGKKPKFAGQGTLTGADPFYSKGRTAHINGNVIQIPDDFVDIIQTPGRVRNGRYEIDRSADGYMPSVGEVLSGAAKNAIPDAARIVGDTWNAVTHPLETGSNVWDLSKSALAMAGAIDGDPSLAQGAWQGVKDAYGGLDNIARRFRDKPVSTALDATLPLNVGGSLAAKAPGLAGKIGRGAVAAADIIDPTAIPGRVVGKALNVGGNIAATAAGVSTGTGGEAYRTMARAGREGDTLPRDTMRGNVDDQFVPDMAKDALRAVDQENREAYRRDIADIKTNTAEIDALPIFKAIKDTDSIVTYKGKTVSEDGVHVRKVVRRTVEDWLSKGGPEFRTVEAGDALYKRLSDIKSTTPPGSREQLVVDTVLNALKGEIEKVAPGYSDILKNYSQGKRNSREIQKGLALGPGATRDQTARALLSTTRNNAQTNYGQRVRLLDQLAKHQPQLPGALAGMALNSLEPRSLARVGTPLAHALAGGLAGGLPGALLSAGAGMVASSPRVMGELAYGAGKAARIADTLTPAQRRLIRQTAVQSGRASETVENQRPWRRYRTK
ncbi:hypothetical protein [Mesorhizobium denitrificans]|uniref:Uncharacterized protein n=1 Tax=Mesorhizobium denitrificans TaxID=2294114 RepID=A0A371XDW3_9HYPH|nr:hypothetical protein [Mesorhizobium denitrificans]RFC67383.1 hypothetical protein DY251_12660 [Mesorhizobium denitrificans]